MNRQSETRAGNHRRHTRTRNASPPTQASNTARGARKQPPNQGTIHAASVFCVKRCKCCGPPCQQRLQYGPCNGVPLRMMNLDSLAMRCSIFVQFHGVSRMMSLFRVKSLYICQVAHQQHWEIHGCVRTQDETMSISLLHGPDLTIPRAETRKTAMH